MSKKSSKTKATGSTYNYQPNDIVLAKLRGYPPWPGMIIKEEEAPSGVAKERPQAKKGPGNVFCVRFFPVGDYSWLTPKEISLLQKHEIEAYINEPHKKNGDLLEGYKIALDPSEWLARKKSEAENNLTYDPENEVDELEDEEDADGEDESGKKTKGTKRKRESETKPKTKKSAAAVEKSKRVSRKNLKSADTIESEEESKPSVPKKTRKEPENDDPEVKKVRDWRHALQRIFLGKTRSKDEDMPAHNKLFTEVESHEGMTLFHLTETKIGKVMRHIALAEDGKIPRNEEFNFKSRAQALVEKWQRIAKEHEDQVAGTQTNGVQTNGTIGSAAENMDIGMEGKNTIDKSADVTMNLAEPNGVAGSSQNATDTNTNGTIVNGQAADTEMKVDAA